MPTERSDVRRWIPNWLADAVLAAAGLLVDVTLFSHVTSPDTVPVGSQAPVWVVVAYSAVGFAVVPFRRRWPVAVFAVLLAHSLVAAALPLSLYHPLVGVLIGVFTLTRLRSPLAGLLSLLTVCIPAAFLVNDALRTVVPAEHDSALASNVAFYAMLGFGVWGLGWWLGANTRRAHDLERHRAAEKQSAIAGERARIADELHDIVAHSVTVMVMQAGGAQQVLDRDPARAGDALARIEDQGRQAMAELRRMLLVLRDDGSPATEDGRAPGLADLNDLLQTFRDAGLPVTLEVSGSGCRLDRSVDLAAYRVIQEALTNVIKHAGPGRPTTVQLTWDDRLTIQVNNTGPTRAATDLSAGHGLLGLGERLSVLSGTFQAASTMDGGFQVTATLPVAGPEVEVEMEA